MGKGIDAARILPQRVMVSLDKAWTAQDEEIDAVVAWGDITETFISTRGIVLVKVEPDTGSGYSGTVEIHADEIPVSGSTCSFTDKGIITMEIAVPSNETLKVLVTAWAGTGKVNLYIRDA